MKTHVAPKPTLDPVTLLKSELERRCKTNPRYSLRAFATSLGMSPTALSFVLTGKRPLSKKAGKKVADRLDLSPEQTAVVLHGSNSRRHSAPLADRHDVDEVRSAEANAHQLSIDSFAFISDWYHYAILSLLDIPGARFEAKWICQKLRISHIEAKNAMERLKRMGIVDKVDGRWKQATGPIRIGNDVPTAATVKFQRQLLQKAMESLDNEPPEVRDLTSMTLAMSSSLIPYAMARIRTFRRKLAEELEAKATPDRVYKLTVQLFPVSSSISNEEKLS